MLGLFGTRRRGAVKKRARQVLREAFGARADFRAGQWEAIETVVLRRSSVLLVQKTGWGKSLVYFLATKLFRESGAGPTLLISPLLSLMRNQIENAERFGITALSINSANQRDWGRIDEVLARDECDLLLISPERLANRAFVERTQGTLPNIGLLVVDEAHCISDWGHDFRPDYRRIARIVGGLPPRTPVMATTATANQRVVDDVVEQLKSDLGALRGPLARSSLRLQTIHLENQAERLAWLAENLPRIPGTGIVYCLTIADCDRVAAWLMSRGIHVEAYHAGRPAEERVQLEERLLRNQVKVLVATVALGMGFDKPDLSFVIHFQRPGSIVAYYQQIGRAGREVDDALTILLCGKEDDEIQEYFIRSAFPEPKEMRAVLSLIETEGEMSLQDVCQRLNSPQRRIEQCLKHLRIERALGRDGWNYFRTANPWSPDTRRAEHITAVRHEELGAMQRYTKATGCLMEIIVRELDDPHAATCGRCANCRGEELVPSHVDRSSTADAVEFLKRNELVIEPRRRWPMGVVQGSSGPISEERRNAQGRALCMYRDPGWGEVVKRGKYKDGRFAYELVLASAELIQSRWRPTPFPTWVTAIPSQRHPELTPDFAQRLAVALGIPFRPALEKILETPAQKEMHNSAQQLRNIHGSFTVVPDLIDSGPVLLVDDIVDSRWTLTVAGTLLRDSGSGVVHPFTLARLSTLESVS